MVQGHRPPGRTGWLAVVSCGLPLAGAVTLVLSNQAGVTFLILFTACTAIMAVAIAAAGQRR